MFMLLNMLKYTLGARNASDISAIIKIIDSARW